MCVKVSVIIATFNASKTIRKALDSVKNQTFQEWECLVIDGASTDNTISVVKEYVLEDSRFRYTSERDKGIYDAFNKGWKLAKGEWIIYLGADDYYFPEGLQSLMEISDDNYDVLYGTCELRFNRTKRIRRNTPLENIGYRLPACHQSMAMRRTAIEHLGGFKLEYPVYGDLDLMQRAYRAGFRFNACDSVISSFFVGGVSSDNLSALSELYNLMRTNKIVKYPRIVILRFYIMTLILKLWHRIK